MSDISLLFSPSYSHLVPSPRTSYRLIPINTDHFPILQDSLRTHDIYHQIGELNLVPWAINRMSVMDDEHHTSPDDELASIPQPLSRDDVYVALFSYFIFCVFSPPSFPIYGLAPHRYNGSAQHNGSLSQFTTTAASLLSLSFSTSYIYHRSVRFSLRFPSSPITGCPLPPVPHLSDV